MSAYKHELNQLTRQQIGSRMLKDAARLWDFQDSEIDSLDPLVKLLIEACANELEKVGHQIHASHARVLSRLARLMTPDFIVGPQPAHAVVQVQGIEAEIEVNPLLQMSYKKELPLRQQLDRRQSKDLMFTPAAIYKVFDGQVKALASLRELQEVNSFISRGESVGTVSGRNLNPNTLFIGLELNPVITSLNGLSFFFDWKNHPQKKEIVELLGDANWFVGGIPVKRKVGLDYKSAVVDPGVVNELFEIYDMARNHEKNINDYYSKQFITLEGFDSEDEIDLNEIKHFPPELIDVFGAEGMSNLFSEPLIWFQVTFPQSSPKDALLEVSCGINCMPIVNRELHQNVQSLRHNINVVPLQTEDLFYQMVSVEDTHGTLYRPTSPLTRILDYKAHTYSLRQGEVGRYDERNAFETLSYLVDLLRDEANAFSMLDRDWLNTEVDNLNQLMARVEDKLDHVYDRESISYLVVKPERSGENAHVRFYSTTGGFANNIPAGTNLKLSAGVEVNKSGIILATTTKEGREKLGPSKSLIAYKQAILTRNRIVTIADIKAHCHKQMAHKNLDLEKVEVKKGVRIGKGEKEGLIRVIEVSLHPKNKEGINISDWNDIAITLKSEMEQASTITYPFSVNVVV